MSRFLLVFLSIEAILQEPTIYRRRQKLRATKGGLDLDGAYGATLGRIKAQGGEKSRLGMVALMWISHSRRPLQVDEICHAVAIRTDSNVLNNDDIPAISTLLGCCQGLVTIEKGSSTIRLIHFTLQKYLCTHPDLFDRTHSTMAETCLMYLNFQHINDLSAHPSPDPQDMPLLEYCSLYWGAHMRMGDSDRAKTFALQLLDQFDGHISAKSLWKSINAGFPRYYKCPAVNPFSALHCISYFGIADVADTLMKTNRWDVNERDSTGTTPLIWAARYGHEEVVRLLLRQKHIQLDQQDANSGRTALSWAAGNGHEGVVRLFLGPRFANPGSIDCLGGEAAGAAGGRHVNPDSSCKYGQTPLSWAARNGHERTVELLLAHKDVNPDSPSKSGRTPLSWAARNDHERVAELLLGKKDVNPDGLTISGRTPLSLAAEKGHEGTVKLLLGRVDVNPGIPDLEYGQTPLSWATRNGHGGTVKLLLEREDASPNIPDTRYGRTPFLWAAENGHEGIVKLLLGWKDINPNIADAYGRTALVQAAKNGHIGVVELLLGRKDVNPNNSNGMGETPLSGAINGGHERVVKLLLGREEVNPDSSNRDGETPLILAARRGHEGTVELLLGRKDVNPDSSDRDGETPLMLAAQRGREGIVKLLLGRKDVNPNNSNRYGKTPLHGAVYRGHERVVELLLGREEVNPDSSDKYGGTPLMLAIRNGHVGVAELLRARLSRPVNPSVQSVRLRVRTGRRAYLKGRPGRTGILASVRKTARDGRAGTAGVSQVAESAVRLHVTGGPEGDGTGGPPRELA